MTIDVNNTDRAAWADATIQLFRNLTGCDREDALGDLLCDLMHWADAHNFDFTLALVRASDHYEAEVAEAPTDPRIPVLLNALEQAVQALNVPPRFPVPSLLSDSYKIATICDRAITRVKGDIR